ncbi:conserved hypothetical protein, partial [Ixodes scapularis]
QIHRQRQKATQTTPPSINILQLNANHTYTATEHLRIIQSTLDIHISLLQEPYYLRNKVIGLALTDFVINHRAQPRAVIILRTKSFDIYPAHIFRDIVVIRLTDRSTDLYIISVYAPPHDNINSELTTLTDICTKFHRTPILFDGDFNAKKRSLWGNRTDDRGAQLAEFNIAREILPLIPLESLPTFKSARGSIWIGITVASQNIIRDITKWTVLSDTTGSDHNFSVV